MKKVIIIGAGPAGLTAGGASQSRFMTLNNGTVRTYKIFVPQGYSPVVPAPLIISYHGRAGNGAEQETRMRLSLPAYNTNYIVAYPDGVAVSMKGRQIHSSNHENI